MEPIKFRLKILTTPAAVFRAFTSQTELRKWWAPRVIMSRNIVSQEEGRDMEMRLLTAEKNHLIRYSWRGIDWPDDVLPTIIAIEIEDLGVSRDTTGEGVQITIIHDGWSNREERDRQELIWNKAVECLEHHLNDRPYKSWWEDDRSRDGFRQITLGSIRQFVEKMDRESKGKNDRKLASKNILQISEKLDGQGIWVMKENGNEFELRFRNLRLFGVQKNGQILIGWRELEKLLGDRLPDFASRLTAEQDVDLHIGKSQDRIPANMINPGFWVAWCLDIIQFSRGRS